MSPLTEKPSTAEAAESLELWFVNLGIARLAATFIEAFGSLSSVLAQFLYVSQPLLDAWLPADKLNSLAEMLEDEEQSAALAVRLRKGKA